MWGDRAGGATRVVVSTFGVFAGLAGVEHGLGEILQGSVRPAGLVIESWPDTETMAILSGEPALTVVPNLLATGVLAVTTAIAFGIWAACGPARRAGAVVLLLLAGVLLLVGGGFAPPLIGLIVGLGATRIGARPSRPAGPVTRTMGAAWPWLTGAGVLGFLGLIPGVPLLRIESAAAVTTLSAVAFTGLILALITARAHDRAQYPA